MHTPTAADVVSDQLIPCLTSSFFQSGSKFRGTQQSDRQTYDVQVEIKHVDMEESFVCGYLRIQGKGVLANFPAYPANSTQGLPTTIRR